MDEKWEGFKDFHGLPRAYRHLNDTNGILFLAYAVKTGTMVVDKDFVRNTLNYYLKCPPPFLIKYAAQDGPAGRFGSHDNVVGFMWLSHRFGFDYHKKMSVYQMWHPRDWSFILAQRHKIFSALLLIYALIMVATCARHYRSKNGQWDTDGKLLYILRRDICPIPIVDDICHALLRWRWGDEYIKTLINTYFWHTPSHPMRLK